MPVTRSVRETRRDTPWVSRTPPSEDPRVTPTRGAPSIIFAGYVRATRRDGERVRRVVDCAAIGARWQVARPSAAAGQTMNKKNLLVGVLIAEAVVCLLLWRSMPKAKITESLTIAWCVTAGLSGFTLRLFSVDRKRVIFLGVVGAAVAANVANIVYDTSRDPTSHNLFPFELAYTVVISLAGGVTGVILASVAAGTPKKQ
jgi:hypothetical protein